MNRLSSFFLALVLFLAGTPTISVAAPDFTRSAITATPESPLEGDVVRFSIQLKNTGDAPAEFAQLKINWPVMGYLIKAEGMNEQVIDHEAGTVSGSMSLPIGGEKAVFMDVLAPQDSGGDALSVSVHLAHYASGAELWEHKTITIDTRIAPTGLRIGGMRLAPAGIAVLVWLLCFGVFWLVASTWCGGARDETGGLVGLIGPGAAVTAIMVAAGFWMIFAAMAWRDYQALTHWTETQATVVGRRTVAQTMTSQHRTSTGAGSTSGSTETFTPELALHYKANGRMIYSTGYDTGSSLRVGGQVRRQKEMRTWVPGAQIPCWYDPANPHDVVVRRGFGGAYVFAVFPLPIFWIGLARLNSCRRRRGAA